MAVEKYHRLREVSTAEALSHLPPHFTGEGAVCGHLAGVCPGSRAGDTPQASLATTHAKTGMLEHPPPPPISRPQTFSHVKF